MGTVYKTEKCWLMIGSTELPCGTVPQFGLLYDVIVQSSSDVYFLVKIMDTINYDPILCSYEVKQLQLYRCLYKTLITSSRYHPFNAVQHDVY